MAVKMKGIISNQAMLFFGCESLHDHTRNGICGTNERVKTMPSIRMLRNLMSNIIHRPNPLLGEGPFVWRVL